MKHIITACIFILIGCSIYTKEDSTWTAFRDNETELIGFKGQGGHIKIKPKYTGFTIARKFDKIMGVTEEKNGQYENYYLTKSGKIVGKENLYIFDNSPDCENDGFIRFRDQKTDNVGMYNGNGDICIPPEYNDLSKVINGMVVALKGARKKYWDGNKHSGCNHFSWVEGKEHLVDTNNHILIENFKYDSNLNLFSLKIGEEPIQDAIRQNFLGVDGRYYAFIDFKKEFQEWFYIDLLGSFSKDKLISASHKEIYFWKEQGGWTKELNTKFITKNYDIIKNRLTELNKENADYFITKNGLNPFIYDAAEFDIYYNNCGEAKEWKYPSMGVVINHKTESDFYQDHFEFLKIEQGYKLISMTIGNGNLE